MQFGPPLGALVRFVLSEPAFPVTSECNEYCCWWEQYDQQRGRPSPRSSRMVGVLATSLCRGSRCLEDVMPSSAGMGRSKRSRLHREAESAGRWAIRNCHELGN